MKQGGVMGLGWWWCFLSQEGATKGRVKVDCFTERGCRQSRDHEARRLKGTLVANEVQSCNRRKEPGVFIPSVKENHWRALSWEIDLHFKNQPCLLYGKSVGGRQGRSREADSSGLLQLSSYPCVTKQDPMGLPLHRLPPCPLFPSCLQKDFSLLGLSRVTKNKFSQRREKMQKQRKIVKQEKIIIV